MTAIRDLIIMVLDRNGGELHGMEHLSIDELDCNNKGWVRQCIQRVEAAGLIEVVRTRGGRGHKNIIRKKNRNSTGYPRKP